MVADLVAAHRAVQHVVADGCIAAVGVQIVSDALAHLCALLSSSYLYKGGLAVEV